MPIRDRNLDLRLGILAVQTGLAAPEAVIAAARTERSPGETLDQTLVRLGVLTSDDQALLARLNERLLVRLPERDVPLEPVGWSAELSAALDDAGSGQALAAETDSVAAYHTVPLTPAPPTPKPPTPAPPVQSAAGSPRSTAGGARFRTVRLHARGGLGQVSLAIDEELNREVALKEIRAQFADDPEARSRFEREAKITGSLEHPGIVPVYGLGVSDDGRPYYAMRFIQGRSMQESIDEYHRARTSQSTDTRLMFRELLKRFVDMCNAVEYAHSRRIVHRDLKPDNVMLGPYGETLVVDWGLAKRGVETPRADSKQVDSEAAGAENGGPDRGGPDRGGPDRGGPANPVDSALVGADLATMHGDVLGTPAYMSPEQARGAGQGVGPASDVYSLGATLYHVLAGKPAFTTSSVQEVLRQVIDGEFPRPRAVVPAVPAALEAICLKAMARRPEDRFASARELAGEIERWLADEPVTSYRERFQERWFRRMRRHRTWTMAVAVMLPLLSIVATAAAIWVDGARREALRQKEISDEAKEAEAAQKQIAVAATDEARRRLANLLLAGGERLESEADLSGALLWHVKALPLLDPQNRAAVEAHRLRVALLLRQLPRPVAAWTLPAAQRARVGRSFVSPDGRKALFCGNLVVGVDSETGRPLWPPLDYGPGALIAWAGFSPDGSRIITLAQKRIMQVWDAATGRPLTAALETAADIPLVGYGPEGKAEISADHRSLVVMTRPAEGVAVEVWDLAAGRRRFDPLPFADTPVAVRFSPDGKQLLVGTADEVRFYDVESGKPAGAPIAEPGLWDAAYSPDGRWFATSSGEGRARIWDSTERAAVGAPLTHRAPVTRLVFSPDSKRLLTLYADRTARLWDAADGKPLGEVLEHADRPFSGSFSADGRRIVTVTMNHAVYGWDGLTGRQIGAPLRHAVEPAVHVAGDRVTVAVDGRGGAWDVSRAAELAGFTLEGEEVRGCTQLRFTPDGRTLVVGKEKRLWLLEADTGKVRAGPLDHDGAVRATAVSSDGRLLAAGCDDGTARLWNLVDGRPLGRPLRHAGAIVQLRFDPAGRRLVTCGGDRTARLWDVDAGTPIGAPLAHEGAVNDADFSPDAARVVTAADDGVARVWNAADGRPLPGDEGELRLNPPQPFVQARFHPEGRTVMAATAGGGVFLWQPDIAGGAMRTFELAGAGVSDAAFSPDGRFLLAAGLSNVIQVWDWRDPNRPPAVLPVVSAAFRAQFRPDSTLVAAASFGGVRLWEADGGRVVGPRLGPLMPALTFRPDGRQLVGAGDRIYGWDLAPDEHPLDDLEKLASLTALRSLDADGNLQFLTPDRIDALYQELSAKSPEDLRPRPVRTVRFEMKAD